MIFQKRKKKSSTTVSEMILKCGGDMHGNLIVLTCLQNHIIDLIFHCGFTACLVLLALYFVFPPTENQLLHFQSCHLIFISACLGLFFCEQVILLCVSVS